MIMYEGIGHSRNSVFLAHICFSWLLFVSFLFQVFNVYNP